MIASILLKKKEQPTFRVELCDNKNVYDYPH